MRSLASAYLQRSQTALHSVRAYEEMVETGLALALRSLRSSLDPSDPWSSPCLLVFCSDQGLCGPFVEALARETRKEMMLRRIEQRSRILLIGQQGIAVFRRLGMNAELIANAPNSLEGAMKSISELTEVIGSLYEGGSISSIQLIYNVFEGVGRFSTRIRQLLPPDTKKILDDQVHISHEPLSHLPFREILHRLLEEYLFIGLHRAMVESISSENGSRLRAMDAATHNCEDMLENLTSLYMQLRQEEITADLLDVISGVEALKGID